MVISLAISFKTKRKCKLVLSIIPVKLTIELSKAPQIKRITLIGVLVGALSLDLRKHV